MIKGQPANAENGGGHNCAGPHFHVSGEGSSASDRTLKINPVRRKKKLAQTRPNRDNLLAVDSVAQIWELDEAPSRMRTSFVSARKNNSHRKA
jgi:hypothetical protein